MYWLTCDNHLLTIRRCFHLVVFFSLIHHPLASSQEISIVVPHGMADIEGDSKSANWNGPFRAIGLWHAKDFDGLPPTHRRITGIALRPDESIDEEYEVFWEQLTWKLSTTSEAELGGPLSENIGPDSITVFEGTLEFVTSEIPDQGPRPFDYRIDFQRPFDYDPSSGRNLIWEIISPTGYNPPLFNDGQSSEDGLTLSLSTIDPQGDNPEFSSSGYVIAEFTFAAIEPVGDFDASGVLDVADIDMLSAEVRAGSHNPAFRLNDDDLVDDRDLEMWVEELRATYFGDANLDGDFNSGDLVAVFEAGKYERDVTASWSEGDWDVDGRFGTGDLVKAFEGGGYEQGPRMAVNAVPEPAAIILLLGGLFGFAFCHRRKVR